MSNKRVARRQVREQESNHELTLQDLTNAGYGTPQDLDKIIQSRLSVAADGTMKYGGFTLTPIGLKASATANEETHAEVGRFLLRLEGSLQWLLGDWLNFGEEKQYHTYAEIAADLDVNEKSLRDYAYVARNVPMSIRIDTLSFGHHQLIASSDEDAQRVWLTAAEQNKWSVKTLRQAINSGLTPKQYTRALTADTSSDDTSDKDKVIELPKYWRREVYTSVNEKRLKDLMTIEQVDALEEQMKREVRAIERLIKLTNERRKELRSKHNN